MMKSMEYILQENLFGDEGIAGDGSLWPTDLLHCDDQTLVSFNFVQNATFPFPNLIVMLLGSTCPSAAGP